MPSNAALRIRIFSALLVLGAILCVFRLYYLQIAKGEYYQARGDRQYVTEGQNSFNRGSIFFTDKDGRHPPAASLRRGFLLAIIPSLVTDPEDTYRKINQYIPIDKETFMARAAKKEDPYEEITDRISEEAAQPVIDMKLPGVRLYADYWRFYPGENMAAQSLGIVAFKGDELTGRYGLERQYEDVLIREEHDLYVNPFAQFFSDVQGLVSGDTQEGNIVTTIEPSVQQFLEDQLAKTQDKWQSTLTGGIIINPQTGEIYALNTYPGFNPNNFQNEKDVAIFSNPLVEHVYEMGSIVKPLTVAAGLDAGVITAKTTYTDTGSITLNSKKISNYDGVARGVVDMQEVLNKSLNLGVSFIVGKLGNELFTNYFYNFGIADRTGIDLPNEAKGLADNLKSPRDVEHATASFGQGIALSPMAITRALATLGNGGYMVTPHLVKEIEYTNSLSSKITPPIGSQVIKKDTSKEITRMLVEVVDKALMDGKVKMEHYSIAAKTGTAQMARESGGGYYTDRYLHSFFGYFPAYDPKFLVFLYTVNPKNVEYASHTLTDPFINIAKFLISYYQIPPDR